MSKCFVCGEHCEMEGAMTPSTSLPEQWGNTTISDREAWLRIFEAIRPEVKSTDYATANTNEAFDAMKKKLEANNDQL